MTTQKTRPPLSTPLELPRRLLVWLFVAVASGTWRGAPAPSIRKRRCSPDGLRRRVVRLRDGAAAHLHVWRLSVRPAPPPRAGLSVDVFIPTYNESVDTGAARRCSPRARWTIRTRPGCSTTATAPRWRALARELGCRYLARADNTDAKAGNLNHALQHSRGELIAIFDADHAPRRDFLTQHAGLLRRSQRWPSCRRRRTSTTWTRIQHRWQRRGRHGVDRAVAVLPRHPARQGLLERGVLLRQLRGRAAHARSTRSAASPPAPSPRTCTPRSACMRKGFESVYHAESLAFGMAPGIDRTLHRAARALGPGRDARVAQGGHPRSTRA